MYHNASTSYLIERSSLPVNLVLNRPSPPIIKAWKRRFNDFEYHTIDVGSHDDIVKDEYSNTWIDSFNAFLDKHQH